MFRKSGESLSEPFCEASGTHRMDKAYRMSMVGLCGFVPMFTTSDHRNWR